MARVALPAFLVIFFAVSFTTEAFSPAPRSFIAARTFDSSRVPTLVLAKKPKASLCYPPLSVVIITTTYTDSTK